MTIATTGGPPNKASARTTPSSLRIAWHAARGPGLVVEMKMYASIAMARILARRWMVHLVPCHLTSHNADLQAGIADGRSWRHSGEPLVAGRQMPRYAKVPNHERALAILGQLVRKPERVTSALANLNRTS